MRYGALVVEVRVVLLWYSQKEENRDLLWHQERVEGPVKVGPVSPGSRRVFMERAIGKLRKYQI